MITVAENSRLVVLMLNVAASASSTAQFPVSEVAAFMRETDALTETSVEEQTSCKDCGAGLSFVFGGDVEAVLCRSCDSEALEALTY